MRSIGFLGLEVDEKHGSLHAALVHHRKEEKHAVGWEKKDLESVESWKSGRYFWLAPVSHLRWHLSETATENWERFLSISILLRCAPWLEHPFQAVVVSACSLSLLCLPLFLFEPPNIQNLSFLYEGKYLRNSIIFGGTNISTIFILNCFWILSREYCFLLWSFRLRHKNAPGVLKQGYDDDHKLQCSPDLWMACHTWLCHAKGEVEMPEETHAASFL